MNTQKRNILTITAAIAIITIIISSAGCARFWDRMSSKGSIIGSTRAPYIVISQSGGLIMDVYKLKDTIVQSEEGSDGWLFRDSDNHPVNIGGDVKIIRLESTDDPLWSKYHEYHMEFESKTYRELYSPDNN